MRKIYLSILLTITTLASMAQMSNTSFENWSSTSYDEPTGFQTGNKDAVGTGLTPVTRVTGNTGDAVRMETMVTNGGDTLGAYIANGDPMQGQGGIPVNGTPTAFTGQYRYNLPGNDSAILLVIFKNSGNIVGSNIFKIKGTGSQNTFTSFSYPVTSAIAPDSVIIAAASSNLIDNTGVTQGSFLELDGIAFTGGNTTIANNEFENWSSTTSYTLGNWESYGEGFTRTTDAHDGTYACSMRTIDYGNGDISSSGMTSGYQTQNGPAGGTPFSQQNDTLVGWYKYSTSCNDTAFASASTSLNGNYVGGNMIRLTPAAQYTFFEIPINSNTTPDLLRIDFSSSNYPYTNSCDGSTLIIDQIGLKSDLLASVDKNFNRKSPFAYPNPTTNLVHVNGGNKFEDETVILVYDLSGRLVMRVTKEQNSDDAINISILQKGRYYYRQASSRGDSMNSFIKQ